MKKMLLYVAAALGLAVVLVIAVLGYLVTSQPDVIHVERTATMSATSADVYPHATDFTKFVQWSPWTDLDPEQEVTFSEPPAGVGAWYAWKGNDEVGEGKMTVTAAAPDKVVHDLEFIAPFESKAEVALLMKPAGDMVEVTWTFDQQADLATKAMTMFMDMDAMLGADYEKGLASLKTKAEADAAARVEAERLAAEAEAAEAEHAMGEEDEE